MMNLSQLTTYTKQQATDAPEPRGLHWIESADAEDDGSNYCLDCATALVDWLDATGCEGQEPGLVCGGGSFEECGATPCDLCGCMLDVSLLESGVRSELEHFEMYGIHTAGHWRYFLAVLESVGEAPELLERVLAVGNKARDIEKAQ